MNCMYPADPAHKLHASGEFTIICLCAEWCSTCREYKSEFNQLAHLFSGVRFLWLDIEDQAAALGDLDIENFPTVLVRRNELVLFFGTMLPQAHHLRRLIETFLDQTMEQSRIYAHSSPERTRWQSDIDLVSLGMDQAGIGR